MLLKQEVFIMPERHPIRRAIGVVRAWLCMMFLVMLWNAIVAAPYLLEGWLRPLPYFFLAAATGVWMWWTWCPRAVIGCASFLTVGMMLRGAELALWADASVPGRMTGVSLWFAMAGTTLAFGILNLIAISRKEAEEWSHFMT